jgi:hypothetical protein
MFNIYPTSNPKLPPFGTGYEPGARLQARDGTRYLVGKDGSFRKVPPTPKQPIASDHGSAK